MGQQIAPCVQVKPQWLRSSESLPLISSMWASILEWRDQQLRPWKYKAIIHTDTELEQQVDKAFRCGEGRLGRGGEGRVGAAAQGCRQLWEAEGCVRAGAAGGRGVLLFKGESVREARR